MKKACKAIPQPYTWIFFFLVQLYLADLITRGNRGGLGNRFFGEEHHFTDTIDPQNYIYISKTLLHIYKSVNDLTIQLIIRGVLGTIFFIFFAKYVILCWPIPLIKKIWSLITQEHDTPNHILRDHLAITKNVYGFESFVIFQPHDPKETMKFLTPYCAFIGHPKTYSKRLFVYRWKCQRTSRN